VEDRGLRRPDYVLCLVVFPAVFLAIGVVVVVTDGRLNHLFWASIALAITSGARAWWVSSAAARLAVAVGPFALGWMAFFFALVVTYAALGGG
jgi:hypothetical protein